MPEQTYETLLLKVAGPVAEVTINRPDKMNALSAQVFGELEHLVVDLRGRDDIRVVIVTGSGEKAFVAGADISELSQLKSWDEGNAFSKSGQAVFTLIERSPIPFIAAVNGFALGGGCELALACHIRICSENAKFGQPEVNLGTIPGYGGTQRLTRIMGASFAADLILTGRLISAKEAEAHQLVSRVVTSADLMPLAHKMADGISQKAPLAIRAALECILMSQEDLPEKGLEREAELFGQLATTEDFIEGTSAFLNKRTPAFHGR